MGSIATRGAASSRIFPAHLSQFICWAMDGRNNTASNCSVPAVEPCYSQMICPTEFNTTFHMSIRNQIWQVDALLITEAVLAVIIIVGVGAYGQRYLHHPFTRFIFLGATTLFLPIVSSVVSTISNSTNTSYVKIFDRSTYGSSPDPDGLSALFAKCEASGHFILLVIWALLVQTVMVNASTVAATEGREGQSKGPPIDLIIQGVWTIYLGFTFEHNLLDEKYYIIFFFRLMAPFSLLCAKIVLKYYAFEKARKSFALGRNPGFIFAYMEKLRVQEANQQSESPVGSDATPPPLLVMREEERLVEIQPRGYAFKDDSRTVSRNNIGLVTFDRVWQLDSVPSISTPQLKGLCLSFALFKLLRCRFARYKLTNAGSMGTLTFFRTLSLQSGEHDRIFRVIADELSFLHDYYYSSLPISYAMCCLPILSIFLSLLTIGYCILLVLLVGRSHQYNSVSETQFDCTIWWISDHLVSDATQYSTGRIFIDVVIILLLALLVMIAEVRDMISYICSNWTKVTLICSYVNHTSSQRFCIQKWVISFLLRCRCKLIISQHWNEEMNQCSVLVLHHRATLPAFVRRLLHLPQQKWKVKLTVAGKVCIINALRRIIDGGLSKGVSSLHHSQVGESFLWACNGKGTSDTVLIWHIATCIVQVRHHSGEASDSDHKTVATQLSQYCAYLVSWCPQLLPDNSAWSTSLYKTVKKDAEGALTGYSVTESSTPEDQRALDDYSVATEAEAESSTAEDERAFSEHPVADQSSRREDGYQKLVRLLSENSKHEVVKDGVKLGKQLVETIEDQETMWKLLAEFWSGMILYLAPSDNLKGHSEAIAQGGELITLLWALLFHAGVVSRPGEDDGTAATSAGVV